MGKTGKIVIASIIALVLILVIAVSLVISNLDRLVQDAIETYGSEAAGAPVEVAGVEVRLRAGEASVSGFQVGNPEGFDGTHALRFDRIDVALDAGATTAQTIVIDRLAIENARLIGEFKGSGNSNLGTISDNLERYSGPAPEEQSAGESIKLVIREFRFASGEMRVINEQLGIDRSLSLPAFTLNDIGSQGAGATVAEAGRQMLQPIIRKAIEAARSQVLQRGREALKEQATERLGDKVGNLLGGDDEGEGGN